MFEKEREWNALISMARLGRVIRSTEMIFHHEDELQRIILVATTEGRGRDIVPNDGNRLS